LGDLKGLESVLSRCQALWFYLDPTVIVVIEIVDEISLEVFKRIEILQIKQLTFEQANDCYAFVETSPTSLLHILVRFLVFRC